MIEKNALGKKVEGICREGDRVPEDIAWKSEAHTLRHRTGAHYDMEMLLHTSAHAFRVCLIVSLAIPANATTKVWNFGELKYTIVAVESHKAGMEYLQPGANDQCCRS